MAFGSQINACAAYLPYIAPAILGDVTTGATATGTTQAGAYALTTPTTTFTTVAAGTGARLPVTTTVSAGDELDVGNFGVNTLAVYPPVGGKLNSAAVNVPAMVAVGKTAKFRCLDGTNYMAFLSA